VKIPPRVIKPRVARETKGMRTDEEREREEQVVRARRCNDARRHQHQNRGG